MDGRPATYLCQKHREQPKKSRLRGSGVERREYKTSKWKKKNRKRRIGRNTYAVPDEQHSLQRQGKLLITASDHRQKEFETLISEVRRSILTDTEKLKIESAGGDGR